MEYNQTVADELGREGVAFAVRTAGELADKTRELLENPSLRENVSIKARALIEKKRGAAGRMAEIIFATLKINCKNPK
jgi:hypothetical protein